MADALVKALRKAAADYYESDVPSMSDAEYDALRDKLYDLDPENSFFGEVGALPTVGRIELPHSMPSLRKVKPDSLSSVKLKGPFVISEKLDGISALWTFDVFNGAGLYLRGNGLIGQDVSHINKVVKGLVRPSGKVCIRGELIVPKAEGLARNWVNGILHQETPDVQDVNKIHFVAYQVIEPAGLTRSQQLTWLKNSGFKVARSWSVPELDSDVLMKLFKDVRSESLYECDGIVVGSDTIPIKTTDALPKDAFAFKVAVDDQRAETTVRAIEWASSRLGEWIPRVLFDPVKIGSANISCCTGVHAGYVREHMLGPGARIVVRRSGDVIPTLDRVIQAATAWQEPPEGRWKWNGVHAVDTTQEKTSDTLALEMAHSLINLGVEGLSATSTKKIVEGGYKDLKALWSCSEEQIQACIGKANGSKLYKALKGLQATEVQWIHAFVGWPKGFGERKIVATLAVEGNIQKWPAMKAAPQGQTMTTFSEICKIVPAYLAWRGQFVDLVVPAVLPAKKGPLPAQKGSYVISGFRDAEIVRTLAARGWVLQERINSDTNVLIVADAKETTKTKAAKEKGIRIISRSDADSLF